jgi:VanZ family protein
MSSTPLLLSNPYSNLNQPVQSRWSALLQAWLPALLFASIFAIESTARFGADHTSEPLRHLWEMVTGASAGPGWTFTHHILRKVGHFNGYGMLSLICFRGFWLTLRNSVSRFAHPWRNRALAHGLALAATLFVASADEIHQTFLPNRTGTFADVVLDTTGGLAYQCLLFLVLLALTYRRQLANAGRRSIEDTPIKIRRRLTLRRNTPRTIRSAA